MDARKEAMALNSGFYMTKRNKKVQPRGLMSLIIVLCRLGQIFLFLTVSAIIHVI